MYATPSQISEPSRIKVIDTLNLRLADGLDLHMQLKVAHWNVRGAMFPSLHPLFESFAVGLAAFNDAIAERAVTLGGLAFGTSRHVAKLSRLADYPQDTVRDRDHVHLIADRIDSYLEGLRESRTTANSLDDTDTVDLLTQIITTFEKHGWFLRASLDT